MANCPKCGFEGGYEGFTSVECCNIFCTSFSETQFKSFYKDLFQKLQKNRYGKNHLMIMKGPVIEWGKKSDAEKMALKTTMLETKKKVVDLYRAMYQETDYERFSIVLLWPRKDDSCERYEWSTYSPWRSSGDIKCLMEWLGYPLNMQF